MGKMMKNYCSRRMGYGCLSQRVHILSTTTVLQEGLDVHSSWAGWPPPFPSQSWPTSILAASSLEYLQDPTVPTADPIKFSSYLTCDLSVDGSPWASLTVPQSIQTNLSGQKPIMLHPWLNPLRNSHLEKRKPKQIQCPSLNHRLRNNLPTHFDLLLLAFYSWTTVWATPASLLLHSPLPGDLPYILSLIWTHSRLKVTPKDF